MAENHYKKLFRVMLMDGGRLEQFVANAAKAQAAVDLILEDYKKSQKAKPRGSSKPVMAHSEGSTTGQEHRRPKP